MKRQDSIIMDMMRAEKCTGLIKKQDAVLTSGFVLLDGSQ